MAAAEPAAETIRVEMAYAAAPHEVWQLCLRLPAGATVADALRASGWIDGLGSAALESLQAGIWGRSCTLDAPLREHDRVELYRGLLVDPKEARRQRYRRDGLKRPR